MVTLLFVRLHYITHYWFNYNILKHELLKNVPVVLLTTYIILMEFRTVLKRLVCHRDVVFEAVRVKEYIGNIDEQVISLRKIIIINKLIK